MWITIGAVVDRVFHVEWMWRVVLLVLSPLWFLGVYLVLIALLPVALWLHRHYDVLVLIWLGGAALVCRRGPLPVRRRVGRLAEHDHRLGAGPPGRLLLRPDRRPAPAL